MRAWFEGSYGSEYVHWAVHIFDIPSFEFVVSGYSQAMATAGDFRSRPCEMNEPPKVEELEVILHGISDEEALKAQTDLKAALYVHLPRDLGEMILRYAWEPREFVGSPVMLCGMKHMFLRGEKEHMCMGVSMSSRKTGVIVYKTRTKLLVAGLLLPGAYIPPHIWASVMQQLEYLEFDLGVAGL